ncbi:TlyA family RNA methyltransferase [Marinobacterium jannaschii]|uniref:TlyA family RNA methyltransferase n=1 Tax=Marinobacterium jannaschii TaxID=64970 RepID=UPI000489062B|nr:TlyA family RNA methyltransferase [Marinobacterium jannaschii]
MQRADLLLVEQGLAQSRTHAQRLLKAGKVKYRQGTQWLPLSKPGLKLDPDTEFEVTPDEADRYASRGALKLLKALQYLGLDLQHKVAIDVGQSTGGFTDCLLQSGAARVVGIEVGHDQLIDRLRNDPRVTCHEGVNGRDMPIEQLRAESGGNGFDLAVMDVSFISQTKILPGLAQLIADQGYLISLVKPQFEVGKEGIGRGGIVRDSSLYPVVEKNIRQCCTELGLKVEAWFESPIKGGDGNTEFLIIAVKQP